MKWTLGVTFLKKAAGHVDISKAIGNHTVDAVNYAAFQVSLLCRSVIA